LKNALLASYERRHSDGALLAPYERRHSDGALLLGVFGASGTGVASPLSPQRVAGLAVMAAAVYLLLPRN
jgi:hypothetical protein